MVESRTDHQSLLLLGIEGQRYALSLDAVDRVVRAAAVTPVPDAPACVLGLVNLAGQLLPVISLRRCLGLPDCPIRPADQFVIARSSRLVVAIVVDEVHGLSTLDAVQTVVVEEVLPAEEYRLQALFKLDGDIILIYDLDRLLSQEEKGRLLEAKHATEA